MIIVSPPADTFWLTSLKIPTFADLILTEPPASMLSGLTASSQMESFPALVRSTLKTSGYCLVFCPWTTSEIWLRRLRAVPLEVVGQIVWDKKNFRSPSSRRHPKTTHELIWVAAGPDAAAPRPNFDSSVISESVVPVSKRFHHSEIPISILQLMIRSLTRPGQMVFDPFMGSGSTLIAAHGLERSSFGVEIDPHVHSLALERIKSSIGSVRIDRCPVPEKVA